MTLAGKPCQIYKVCDIPGGESYLFVTPAKTALIDTGFAFGAPQTYEGIKAVLGTRPLDYILLTHSHYDHVGASAYLRERMPGVQVMASERAAHVLGKPSAISVMRSLDEAAAREEGVEPRGAYPEKFPIDRVLHEGDLVDMGARRYLTVMETPGHTRDCLMFWCPRERLLIACETLGVVSGQDEIMPACLVSYDTALLAIARIRMLKPRAIVMPHTGLVEGESRCSDLLDAAERGNKEMRAFIRDRHDAGRTDEQMIDDCRERYYKGRAQNMQPLAAFEANAPWFVKAALSDK